MKRDFKDFKTKMTELDTLKVGMFIGACTYHTSEKLVISKKKDSLLIQPYFKRMAFSNDKYIKQKTILIHEKDSVWKFGEFLSLYCGKDREEDDSVIFSIKSDTSSLKFYTKGVYQRDVIVRDYCKVMKQLIPNSKYHVFGEVIEIDEDE
ncbi:hypothetical protein [Tenacibaculum ovolyticum]|uniref:hypothetical protein n=1 Tax=Tenacibaculum ovolyticum TaxID=104270 RepID=UPI003BAC7C29